MLQYKNVTFFLVVLLLIVGCASSPKITMLGTAGELIPNPHYRANNTGNSQLKFVWYYVQDKGVKDLDMTMQPMPVFLDRKESHSISRKTTLGFKMILRVYNPAQRSYSVTSNKRVEYTDGKEFIRRRIEGESFLEFRQWEFPFPYNDRVKKMESFIEIHQDKNIILRTRKFSYSTY